MYIFAIFRADFISCIFFLKSHLSLRSLKAIQFESDRFSLNSPTIEHLFQTRKRSNRFNCIEKKFFISYLLEQIMFVRCWPLEDNTWTCTTHNLSNSTLTLVKYTTPHYLLHTYLLLLFEHFVIKKKTEPIKTQTAFFLA